MHTLVILLGGNEEVNEHNYDWPYLKPDDNWRCQVQFFGSSDNTFGNDITSHNATENVDHNGVNLNN